MNLINTGDHEVVQVDFHPAFDRARLCHSDTALRESIDNRCPSHHLRDLARLSHLLGQTQALLGDHPLTIHSGYRCELLNARVGGVQTSQHCLGQAVDFTCPGFGSPRAVARALAASDLPFDQLILEFDRWVHLSVPSIHSAPRREILTVLSKNTGYQEGIIDS